MTHDKSRRSDHPWWVRPGGDAPAATPGRSSGSRSSYRWSLVLAFVLLPAPVCALLISFSFESISGSVPLTGAGTSIATLDFGRVSVSQPLNAGVTRTRGASSYTLSTRFGVRATHQFPQGTPSYTLQARLLIAQPITWRINDVPLSTSPATIAPLQPYGRVLPHTIAFVVPFSQPAGALNTVLEVTAIAN